MHTRRAAHNARTLCLGLLCLSSSALASSPPTFSTGPLSARPMLAATTPNLKAASIDLQVAQPSPCWQSGLSGYVPRVQVWTQPARALQTLTVQAHFLRDQWAPVSRAHASPQVRTTVRSDLDAGASLESPDPQLEVRVYAQVAYVSPSGVKAPAKTYPLLAVKMGNALCRRG